MEGYTVWIMALAEMRRVSSAGGRSWGVEGFW